MPPIFSIIIVNWNGERFLPDCLEAVFSQTRAPDEVIVIDNGSDDGSLAAIEKYRDNIVVIESSKNLGFAAACNLGALEAKGDWLIFLNPDAFPDTDWLDSYESAIRRNPNVVSFTGLLLSQDRCCIDGAGDVYHISGLAWRRLHGTPVSQAAAFEQQVFSACGASSVVKREIFIAVGGFDEDFFCYMEDVDLGFRLQLLGYQCLLVPDAVARHIGSASTGIRSEFVTYHGHRNLEWTFVKNMPIVILLTVLPLHLLLILVSLVLFTLRGQGRVIVRAKYDAVIQLPKFWRKRKKIQYSRRRSVTGLLQVLNKSVFPLSRRSSA